MHGSLLHRMMSAKFYRRTQEANVTQDYSQVFDMGIDLSSRTSLKFSCAILGKSLKSPRPCFLPGRQGKMLKCVLCAALLLPFGNCLPLIYMLRVIDVTFLDFVRYGWDSSIPDRETEAGRAGW